MKKITLFVVLTLSMVVLPSSHLTNETDRQPKERKDPVGGVVMRGDSTTDNRTQGDLRKEVAKNKAELQREAERKKREAKRIELLRRIYGCSASKK